MWVCKALCVLCKKVTGKGKDIKLTYVVKTGGAYR